MVAAGVAAAGVDEGGGAAIGSHELAPMPGAIGSTAIAPESLNIDGMSASSNPAAAAISSGSSTVVSPGDKGWE